MDGKQLPNYPMTTYKDVDHRYAVGSSQFCTITFIRNS